MGNSYFYIVNIFLDFIKDVNVQFETNLLTIGFGHVLLRNMQQYGEMNL